MCKIVKMFYTLHGGYVSEMDKFSDQVTCDLHYVFKIMTAPTTSASAS